MNTCISIFLFVFFPLITFSQNEKYHRPYEIAISNINGKHKIADSLKLILHSTTDTSIICFPAYQYLDYINKRSITLKEIRYNQIEIIYFNKRGNTMGRTLLISTAIGATVGFIIGGFESQQESNSYSPITSENVLWIAPAVFALEGFIVGCIIWTGRHHVWIGYNDTIKDRQQKKLNKFSLK